MMYLAFYKARYGELFDKLIAAFSKSPYSHVELVFGDGTNFSSSPRDGGSRFKAIPWDKTHWDYLAIDGPTLVPQADPGGVPAEILVRVKAEQIVKENKGYDWLGVLRFVFKSMKPDPKKYFCTEAVVEALQNGGILKDLDPSVTSPGDLYTAVVSRQDPN